MKRRAFLIGLLAVGCVRSEPVPAPSTPLPVGRAIVPPFGFIDMCVGSDREADDELCHCLRTRDAACDGQKGTP